MKKSELRKLIREIISEQTPSGASISSVSSKGCCKDLHQIKNFIALHQQNIANIQELFSLSLPFENEEQLQMYENSINQAEASIANAEDIFNQIQATGCCKGDRY